MSSDNKDSDKTATQRETKPEKLQNIDAAKVSDKDADALKGGRAPLNPQPLPPRW